MQKRPQHSRPYKANTAPTSTTTPSSPPSTRVCGAAPSDTTTLGVPLGRVAFSGAVAFAVGRETIGTTGVVVGLPGEVVIGVTGVVAPDGVSTAEVSGIVSVTTVGDGAQPALQSLVVMVKPTGGVVVALAPGTVVVGTAGVDVGQ